MEPIITWNEEKNILLKQERWIGFEDVLLSMEEEKVLDILPHHNPEKYPNQSIYVVEVSGYIYYVPFVKNKQEIFLKTIIPSRKYKKQYNS